MSNFEILEHGRSFRDVVFANRIRKRSQTAL